MLPKAALILWFEITFLPVFENILITDIISINCLLIILYNSTIDALQYLNFLQILKKPYFILNNLYYCTNYLKFWIFFHADVVTVLVNKYYITMNANIFDKFSRDSDHFKLPRNEKIDLIWFCTSYIII